jgi:hypothetical protein
MHGTLHHRSGAEAARCRWKVIQSFIMKSGCRSCALAAASSSALGINRRKITHTSTSRWVMPVRSSAPIALRYSASIRAWAHTNLIRQIVLTVTGTELNCSSAASFVMPAAANQRRRHRSVVSGRFTMATNDPNSAGCRRHDGRTSDSGCAKITGKTKVALVVSRISLFERPGHRHFRNCPKHDCC